MHAHACVHVHVHNVHAVHMHVTFKFHKCTCIYMYIRLDSLWTNMISYTSPWELIICEMHVIDDKANDYSDLPLIYMYKFM